jgi:hypothetical protein
VTKILPYQILTIHFGHFFDTRIREVLTPHQGAFDAVLTRKAALGGMPQDNAGPGFLHPQPPCSIGFDRVAMMATQRRPSSSGEPLLHVQIVFDEGLDDLVDAGSGGEAEGDGAWGGQGLRPARALAATATTRAGWRR